MNAQILAETLNTKGGGTVSRVLEEVIHKDGGEDDGVRRENTVEWFDLESETQVE